MRNVQVLYKTDGMIIHPSTLPATNAAGRYV